MKLITYLIVDCVEVFIVSTIYYTSLSSICSIKNNIFLFNCNVIVQMKPKAHRTS